MYKRISKKHGPSRRGSDTAFHFAWQFFPFLLLPPPPFEALSSSLPSSRSFFSFSFFPFLLHTVFFFFPPDSPMRRWCPTTEAAQWRSGMNHLVREAPICIKGNSMSTRDMFDSSDAFTMPLIALLPLQYSLNSFFFFFFLYILALRQGYAFTHDSSMKRVFFHFFLFFFQ